jgi:hypothetical protein
MGAGAHPGQLTALTLTLPPQMHHFPELLGRLLSTNLFYFKSSWDDVRAAAPMFTGEYSPCHPRSPHVQHTPDPHPPPQGSWCCTQSQSTGCR